MRTWQISGRGVVSHGGVIKYVSRYQNKNGREDLEKAIHMINLLIEMEYGETKIS